MLLLEGLKYLVTAWRFQLAFSLVQINQPLWFFLVLAPAAGVAGFIAITPAAVGFREAFVTGGAMGMGVTVTEGLLGATVDRAVMFAVAVVTGALGLIVTYPRLRAASSSERPTSTRSANVHG